MAAVINTNIAALNAQRNLNSSQSALQTSLQRLSSGLRINSAKDDAAGMAISDRMTSQIRGSQQAARNANDGISMAQTAEGGLNEISNNLQRIRELSIQSANATNSTSDRAALQAEVSQLVSEIDRVSQNTSFNSVKLLDGTFTAQQFQVGAGATANDRINIDSIASARTTALGATPTTTYSATTLAGGGAPTAALNAGDLIINGRDIGAVAQDARAITNAVNAQTGLTNVTATASASSSGSLGIFSGLTGTAGGTATYSLSAGGVNIVNNQAITSSTTSGSLGGFTSVTGGGTETYSLTAGGVTVFTQTDLSGGVTAGQFDTQLATNAANLTAAGVSYTGSATAGNLTFTKADGTTLAVAEAFTGTGAGGFTTTVNGGSQTNNPTYNPNITGAYVDSQISTNAAALTAAGISYTGTAAGGNLIFSKADGSNLSLTETLGGNAVGGLAGLTGTQVSRGTVTLSGSGVDGITITGANATFAGANISAATSQATTATVNNGAALSTADISTVAGANAALSIIDAALTSINSSRGNLGAIQNRFTSVVANLGSTVENLTAARSRIQDTDFAAETASLTRGQILQQAGTAMLAQANQLPNNVLSLLR
ncbi:MAG: flagellin [Sulfuriferula multivorans]|uniref:Flagellin n=1 Tax=Sulfuriferula multivorans TaxID=1559896 RepID=A0A7C9K1D7_9PROT|nr:flagellin [Sulfuriferula multivorans]